jgi:hypothetical protein
MEDTPDPVAEDAEWRGVSRGQLWWKRTLS